MADLTTAQKAPVKKAGANVTTDTVVSSDPSVVRVGVVNFEGDFVQFAFGDAPGDATITVTSGGRTGTVDVTVTEEPLDITLGTPIAK